MAVRRERNTVGTTTIPQGSKDFELRVQDPNLVVFTSYRNLTPVRRDRDSGDASFEADGTPRGARVDVPQPCGHVGGAGNDGDRIDEAQTPDGVSMAAEDALDLTCGDIPYPYVEVCIGRG